MDSRLIGGKYQIERKIDEGGLARIFLAQDRINKQTVVLKIPVDDDDLSHESLKNEYLFSYTHCHPSLLKPRDLIYDSHKPILVTPYLEGHALDKHANLLKDKTAPDKYHRLLKNIFAEILEAAGFIHFTGYCYNDFKPSNIIARERPERESGPWITLIDFNLVTRIGDIPKRAGTLHYLAPEVLCGNPPAPASDIYSLGVLFYQLLTGNLPHDSGDESELIANIINAGKIDSGAVPDDLRPGLFSMLSRDPRERPQTALEAAQNLGCAEHLADLRRSRSEYYLTAGPPPFYRDLKKRLDQFRKSTARKLFYINGYSYGGGPLNFLEANYRLEHKSCIRIPAAKNSDDSRRELDDLISGAKSDGEKIMVLIEDLDKLDAGGMRILFEMVNNRDDIRVAAVGGRWINTDLKREVFDPLKLWSGRRAARETLKSFLKREIPDIRYDILGEMTGGDPEQIFNIMRQISRQRGPAFIDGNISDDQFRRPGSVIENQHIYQRMLQSLTPEQRELISMLSAWGNSIPLLMFVKFDNEKRDMVELLIKKGFLIRHKDSVSFFSSGFREHIYDGVALPMKNEFHKFWAIEAEELIGDNEERLELSAYHWGLSGDHEQGFKYNQTAAAEFLKGGKILKASKFADTLLEMDFGDVSERKTAMKISGDIYSAMGYVNSARKMYLRILSFRDGNYTGAAVKKALAGLYLASENYRKSIYYIGQALEFYGSSGDRKGFTECDDIITSALMGEKDYAGSLERIINVSGDHNGFNLEDDLLRAFNPETCNDEYLMLNSILNLAQHFKNHNIMIKAFAGLGKGYLKNGSSDEAMRYFSKALDASEKAKLKNQVIDSLINLGSCHFKRGDLFMGVECFQNARQVAESSGNFYLRTLAELKLTDISLAMGNYVLVSDVLRSIENHDIYNEDKYLKLRVDLRRAALWLALGHKEKSLELAERIARSATVRKRHRLALRADIIICRSQKELYDDKNLDRLRNIHNRADKFDLPDLVSEARLYMGEYHLNNGNYQNARPYFEDIRTSPGATRAVKLRAAIYLAVIAAGQDIYKEAVENLMDVESSAAASGYIPIALRAAEILSEIYYRRGRADLADDCHHRADSYLEKILSASPEGSSTEQIAKSLKSTVGKLSFQPTSTAADTAKKPAAVEIR